MKYSINQLIPFLLCFLTGAILPLQAQELEKDLLKMKESLHTLKSCRVELTTSLFNSTEPNKAFDKNRTTVWQKGWYSFSKNKKMEVLLNGQYLLTYVPEQALVSISRHSLKESPASKISLEKIEEAFSTAKSVAYKGVFDKTKCYVVKPAGGAVDVVEYYLDAESGLPVREVHHYPKELELGIIRSVMEYQFIEINQSISEQKFSESRYVEVNAQNEVKLKPKYRNCQLIVGGGLSEVAGVY